MNNLSQQESEPLKLMAERYWHPDGKYVLAELFNPPRMIEMSGKFGLKGGWSIDDRVEDPITKRTNDLRNERTRTKSAE